MHVGRGITAIYSLNLLIRSAVALGTKLGDCPAVQGPEEEAERCHRYLLGRW